MPRGKPGWISFRPYSGGEMTGWGAPRLDQVQWALGMDDSGPVEVWVEGEKFDPPTYHQARVEQRGEQVCSVPKVFFRYANGIVLEPGNGRDGSAAIFIGEKGKITINRGNVHVEPARDRPGDHARRERRQRDPRRELDGVHQEPRKAGADVEIGHRSATVCHLGNIARWTGRKLRWDPVQESLSRRRRGQQVSRSQAPQTV